MGGPAHKHCKGRTFLVRQRDRVRVDADAAAVMLSYELDVSREAAESRCTENFRAAFGFSTARETRVRLVYHVGHVTTDFIPILIRPYRYHPTADRIESRTIRCSKPQALNTVSDPKLTSGGSAPRKSG